MRAWIVIAALLLAARAESQGAPQYLGKTIIDVRVEVAGVALLDPAVLELIETRVGEPLSMRDVRGTIDHLVGLGRFEDLKVFAAPADQGVTLRWQVVPVKRITKITVAGNAVLPASAIRAELNERFGALPSSARVNDMVLRLQAFYAERGFEHANILPRIQDEEPAPERSELVLTIEAGARISIGATDRKSVV